MANMVVPARDHATSAAINYRDYRNRFGTAKAIRHLERGS